MSGPLACVGVRGQSRRGFLLEVAVVLQSLEGVHLLLNVADPGHHVREGYTLATIAKSKQG